MTRQKKSARQRAEEQLAVAERAVRRWAEKRDHAQDEYEAAEREHAAAVRRRDHYANHPDLDTTQPRTTTSTGDTHQ